MSKEWELGNLGRDAKFGTAQREGGILQLYWYVYNPKPIPRLDAVKMTFL